MGLLKATSFFTSIPIHKRTDGLRGRKARKGYHLTTGCDIPDGS